MANPVLAEILRQGRGRPKKHIKAAIETGLVESNLRNLDHGDADSKGWRQERASLYKDPMNLRASVARFYREAAQHDRGGISSGELAARVQRPAAQYRGRYAQRSGEAEKLLGKAGSAAGDYVAAYHPGTNTTNEISTFDQAGYEKAQRGALLASMLQRQGRAKNLFQLGVLSTSMPDRSQFEGTTTVRTSTPGRLVGGDAASGATSSGSGGGGGRAKGKLRELFYDPGINIDEGHRTTPIGGHSDHVHVAVSNDRDRNLVLDLARRSGVVVTSEGTGKHAPGSFHYRKTKRGKSQGIDFGGTPQAMAAFNRRVAAAFR